MNNIMSETNHPNGNINFNQQLDKIQMTKYIYE